MRGVVTQGTLDESYTLVAEADVNKNPKSTDALSQETPKKNSKKRARK